MKKVKILYKNTIKTKLDEYLNQNAEVRFMQRLQVIQFLIDHEQESCISAGKIFNISPRAILNWVHKLNKTGDIESLRDQPGKGRKTRLTKAQVTKIEKAVKSKPSKSGINAKQWTGELLAKYITTKFGIELQGRQCQRILQRSGVANARGRPLNRPE
ncbi:MAG: helix-turn-helix domain-containing protein [Chitinophagaceae bacterium]